VWWLAVPGTLVSEVALAAMLIGGVTTIATNMNPLIPLDGYFALSDWLEIPNLRQRAFGYLSWAVKRYVLRLDANEPPATDRERRVFLLYAGLATCYISGIFLFLAALVLGWAGRFLGIAGVLLTGALLVAMAWSSIFEWGRTAAMSFRVHRAALLASPWRKRGLAAIVALLLVLLLVPRWITVTGGFTATPARALVLIAPDSGIVRQVIAREGVRVAAGTPLVRIQDLALDQERAARLRAVDSLTTEQSRARAQGRGADAEQLDAERSATAARLTEIDARLGALVLRARADGRVMTARPEQLTGRRVESGDTLVTVADSDSLDVRLTVSGAGATLVQPGQTMSLVTYAGAGRPMRAVVRSVSPAAGPDPGNPGVEVRARIGSGGSWRAGVTGEASVRLRRSNLLGALWWGVRQRVRSDLLL
jgi:putative peptide zinc metalloprotease protein